MERKAAGMKEDFLASYLRSLNETFHCVLINLESWGKVDYDYVNESLRRAETHIRNLRKFLSNN